MSSLWRCKEHQPPCISQSAKRLGLGPDGRREGDRGRDEGWREGGRERGREAGSEAGHQLISEQIAC